MDYTIIIIFTIIIIVVPIQILLFLCLIWFRKKVDKYENIALKLVDNYIDNSRVANNTQNTQNINYTKHELMMMVGYHNKIRLENKLEDYFPELYITNDQKIIISQYRKISELYGLKNMSCKNNKKLNILDKLIAEKPLVGAALDLATMMWLYFTHE